MTPQPVTTYHELLGRVRARVGALRPRRGVARRTVFRAMLFATFVAAVSFVGRAWALARLPSSAPTVADRVAVDDADTSLGGSAGLLSTARETRALPAVAAASPTPPPASSPGAESAAAAEPLVNLNTATASELETLPYVGPKRAQAILALRTKVGRFKSVDELLKVKGIGRGTLKRMRPKLTVGAT